MRSRTVEKLSVILWRERELLEAVHYHLEVEQLVLANGRTRWLMKSAADVEADLEQVRHVEVARAIATDEVAESMGLRPNSSLTQLIGAAGEPWATILTDHRDALARVTQEISGLADVNRSLITAGYRSARETLMTLGGPVDGYSPDGSAVSGSGGPRHLDRAF